MPLQPGCCFQVVPVDQRPKNPRPRVMRRSTTGQVHARPRQLGVNPNPFSSSHLHARNLKKTKRQKTFQQGAGRHTARPCQPGSLSIVSTSSQATMCVQNELLCNRSRACGDRVGCLNCLPPANCLQRKPPPSSSVCRFPRAFCAALRRNPTPPVSFSLRVPLLPNVNRRAF